MDDAQDTTSSEAEQAGETYHPQPLRPFVPRGGIGKRAGQRDEYYSRNRETILRERHVKSMKAWEDRGAPTPEEKRRSHERRSAAAKKREKDMSPEVKAAKARNLNAGRAKKLKEYKAQRHEWEAICLRTNGASLIEIADKLGFGGKNRKRVRTALRSVDLPERGAKRLLFDRGEAYTRNRGVLFYRSLGQSPAEFAALVGVRPKRITIWFSALWKNLTPGESRACIALRGKIAAKLLTQDARGFGFDAYSRPEVLHALFPRLRVEYGLLRRALKPLREFFRANPDAGEPELAAHIISGAQTEKAEASESRLFRELICWLPEIIGMLITAKGKTAGEEVFNRIAGELLAETVGVPFALVRHALESNVRPTTPERMRELLRAHLPELSGMQAKPKVPKKRGRERVPVQDAAWYKIGQRVESLITEGTGREDARVIAARNAVVKERHHERATVVRAHLRYRAWMKEHPQA